MKLSFASILVAQSLILMASAAPLPADDAARSIANSPPVERYHFPGSKTTVVHSIDEILASQNLDAVPLVEARQSSLGPYASQWGFSGNNYPIVMVHGLMGWGEQPLLGLLNYWGGFSGSLVNVLRNKGYTVYQPAVAPASSNWERACELYAQLKGTRVDYGIARAKKFGHERFGKDFTGKGLYPEWGNPGKKAHFIGHSMGGPTTQLLLSLLQSGSAAEIQAAQEAGVPASPLFYTNKTASDFAGGFFAISGVLQGTPMVEIIDNWAGFIIDLVKVIAGVSDLSDIDGLLWDFQLDHWGLGYKQGESLLAYFNRIFTSSWAKGTSNAAYDLSITGARDARNANNVAIPGVYYFSIPTSTTVQVLTNEVARPSTLLFLIPFANALGTYQNTTMFGTESAAWRDNDGLVPVITSSSDTKGYINYSMDLRDATLTPPRTKPTTGKYHNTGIIEVDHIEIVGLLDAVSLLRWSTMYTNIGRILLSLPA
ncbi:Alpha/Beta hydrolase protein [Cladochytrium replicatum]|nr:Alpha/Beta hydrolase protein [Cladochytrium replicatum]